MLFIIYSGEGVGATAQVVETLGHKTGDPGFASRLIILLPAFSSPGVHSASNRNESQGIDLGGGGRG
jgi:hypothetical protein